MQSFKIWLVAKESLHGPPLPPSLDGGEGAYWGLIRAAFMIP